MVAGTSKARTRVASMMTAIASPTPICLMKTSSEVLKAASTVAKRIAAHGGWDQQGTHQGGIHDDRNRQPHPNLLNEDEFGGAEGSQHCGEEDRSAWWLGPARHAPGWHP